MAGELGVRRPFYVTSGRQHGRKKLMGQIMLDLEKAGREVFRAVVDTRQAEFVDSLLAWRIGAERQNFGYWQIFDGISVCHKPSLESCPTESGWERWRLPSADGRVRGSPYLVGGKPHFPRVDRDAPWVSISPGGVIFLCQGLKMPKRVTLGQMLDFVHRYGKEIEYQPGDPRDRYR